MGEFTRNIKITDTSSIDDISRIDVELKTLMLTTEGTIPGSRDFGLSGFSPDLMTEDARNQLFAELDEKVDKYIPQITVTDIELEGLEEDMPTLRLYIEGNSDTEDES